ncbi:MAG: biotin/lipoyl-binding protein [Lachnospiraceae bacterium]|nr:biotin/lipoyl-binding protein [Lachnospiraceae bacterium]
MPLLKKNKVPKPPKQKKHKGKIAAFIVLGIIVLAVVGGSIAYRYYGTKAYVQPISDINMTWVLSNGSSEGVIQDAATQNIYWDATSNIKEVYVKKGDTVAAGDKLFQYDTESLTLQVEQAQLSLDVAKYNLQVAQQQLENTGKANIVPDYNAQMDEIKRIDAENEAAEKKAAEEDASRQATQDAEYKSQHEIVYTSVKETENANAGQITGALLSTSGEGTVDNPWVCEVDDKAIISKASVDALISDNKYLKLVGNRTNEEGTVVPFELEVGGSAGLPLSSEYRLIATKEEFVFAAVEPTTVNEIKYPEYDPRGLTENEKKEQTASDEVGIKKAENAVKSAQINLDDAKRRLDEATVTAKISGVILTMGDYENPPQDGSAFITVSSQNGLAVTGYVSELQLDSMKEGDEISISSWESGTYATATVTEVSQYPATNYQSYSNGNNNVSWYPYTAYIENADGFKTGEYVQISKVSVDDTDAIVLEKIYVRSDEKGNYVLADNGSGRLERRDVTVANTSENEYVQILSGLTTEDLIAFPYGSKGKVGVKTTTEMSVFDMLF